MAVPNTNRQTHPMHNAVNIPASQLEYFPDPVEATSKASINSLDQLGFSGRRVHPIPSSLTLLISRQCFSEQVAAPEHLNLRSGFLHNAN
jgi:hypothetical protein